MKTKLIQNKAIMASAGCGKTEELAMRYIRLLAAGAKPESILALTFTRLAAGEMLGRVFVRLSGAVLDKNKRQDLINQLGRDEYSNVDFARILKLLIEKLNCLRLATLDSFFVELVKCFAPELGVDLNLQLTDDFSESILQTKAIEQIYLAARENKEYFKQLKITFDKLTQQKEESNIEKQFVKGIEDGYDLFLRTGKKAWGKFPPPDFDTSNENWEKIVEEFETCESFKPLLKREKNSTYLNYLAKLKKHDIDGITKTGPIKKLLNKETEKKMTYGANPNIWDLLDESNEDNKILQKIINFILAKKLKELIPATKAYHTFLNEFHQKYSEIKANSGVLTFSDICRLLNNNDSLFMDAGRMEMFFRLDATVKHLLIDEFQDTSWDQWNAIAPIAEEIICDTDGERSFFIVGDIKQAIYSWRGGDSELFGKIIDYYKGHITETSLAKSWRSGNNILESVNRIFNSEEEKIKKWKEKSKFKDHTSAVNEKNPGYTEIRYIEPENFKGKSLNVKEKTVAKQEVVISLLKKIRPWEHGLKTALIFSANKEINDWIAVLKNAGIPCFSQGKSRLLDDAAVQAVLALFRWMDMPEDKLAEYHVKHSFLSDQIKNKKDLYKLKQFLFYNSYSEFIEKVAGKMKNKVNESTRVRLNQLIEIAEQYQPNASSRPADFINYVEKIHQKEPAASEGVTLITMHSSKGMTYDIVFLAEMEKSLPNKKMLNFIEKINEFDGKLKQPETSSVLLRPTGDIANADEQLTSMINAGLDKLEHEFFNMMYVALTRASKGLYIICSKGKNTFSNWIIDALSGYGDDIKNYEDIPGDIFYKKGDSLWYEKIAGQKDDARTANPKENSAQNAKLKNNDKKTVKLSSKSERQRQYITPTSIAQKDLKTYNPEVYFGKQSQKAEKGIIIHELFASIEWLESDFIKPIDKWKAIAKHVSTTFSEKECEEIVDEFIEILDKEQIKKILLKPIAQCEVLNEKTFAAIIDNKLVRGTFDRVVLYPNSKKPEKIELYDYKTGEAETDREVSSAVKKYMPQIDLYAQVLNKSYNISKSEISNYLIFASPGIVQEC